MSFSEIDQRSIAVIKGLAMDAPHAAKSGHQGTAMALAPLAHVLWTEIMKYDAGQPLWPDRDRFILSAGHASILLYSMLHLTGYGLTLDDLKKFRQLNSITPGHPERGHTDGVEVTTGPLGQGFANGVGMAIAERNLRTRLGDDLCNHNIWVVCGDGDLSEGISHEAASLAGHLKLERLTVIYDDNQITIDGPTDLALSDDAALRFRSYGWNVIELGEESENLESIKSALLEAKTENDRPSIVILKTHIGEPSPHTDTAAVHGYSLKDEEISETKIKLGLPENETFFVPDDVLENYRAAGTRGEKIRQKWEKNLNDSNNSTDLWSVLSGSGLKKGWEECLPVWEPDANIATRNASNECIQSLMEFMPGLIGGGADLTGNTGTSISGYGIQSADQPEGRQIFFGVREHAMGAISNGISLHGGLFPVTGTFLVFSDYMRGAVRLAALSNAKGVFIWSHDSVAVGEDGPTHQPIEHLVSLRSIPNLKVFRPADTIETFECWQLALEAKDFPSAIALTRQKVNPVRLAHEKMNKCSKGAYEIMRTNKNINFTILSSGSEVSLAIEVSHKLATENIYSKVISMPCQELFDQQKEDYRKKIINETDLVVSIEASETNFWQKYTGPKGLNFGIDSFGKSAPYKDIYDNFELNSESIIKKIKQKI